MHIEKEHFGTTVDGEEVIRYTVKNNNGYELSILNYGGIIQKFLVPDKNGIKRDIVLGFDTLAPYELDGVYMGGILGRYASRLDNAQFNLNDETISVSQNEGANHFHGGFRGYHKHVWKATDVCKDTDHGIELTYTSKDGEEGYPGELINVVSITLSDENEVKVFFHATSSQSTPINLTYSAYFNFLDCGKDCIKSHKLKHFAKACTPFNQEKVVTGEITSLPHYIERFHNTEKISDFHESGKAFTGIDDNLIIEKFQYFSDMAVLSEENTGIQMKIISTQPCIHIYTGQDFDHQMLGKYETKYKPFAGICMEPQGFPDSMNHPNFPPSILNPTGVYKQKIHYSFKVDK